MNTGTLIEHKFTIDKDPYGLGSDMYRGYEVKIQPGFTVLVGCNGSGKTTLLQTIASSCCSDKIPYKSFNNLSDGGVNLADEYMFKGKMSLCATIICSSEGERIFHFIEKCAAEMVKFCDDHIDADEIFFLFDAVDSGWSIDNIDDFKQFCMRFLEDHNNQSIYIIVSANEYEMCRDVQCYDVYNQKYRTFKTYETYRKFIMKSREIKNNRYSSDSRKSPKDSQLSDDRNVWKDPRNYDRDFNLTRRE